MKRSFFKDLASFFALYGILFIPFPFYITDLQSRLAETLFGRLIPFIADIVFGKRLRDSSIYSDSTSMYVLVLLLFLLATFTVLLLQLSRRWPARRSVILAMIYRVCIYYLALQLMKYGVDKIFKNQFYLPEPNTLYTRMGDVPKDLLYWSSMGTSHLYSVFMGVLETVAAILLFFRRTRLIGLLMSLAILLNVVAVNFGFDIGVKLFSLFLLVLNGYLLVPYTRSIFLFLTQRAVEPPATPSPRKRSFFRSVAGWLLIGLVLLEAFYPFLRTGNFNGDKAKRIYLHGAYQVHEMISGGDTLAVSSFPVKRIFVHSDGYMIFEDSSGSMQDYKFSYDIAHYKYELTDYKLRKIPLVISWQEKDSILTINYTKGRLPTGLKAKAIDWRKLPALKKGFHWTTD